MSATGTVYDNLIIGAGPSAVAGAMALRRLDQPFEVIDAGFDLEPDRVSAIERIARREPAAWNAADRELLFPPPRASAKGVEKRYAFGSDFPYRMPPFLTIDAQDCIIDVSHGTGGFGNVWGAAILPYADRDLAGWPITVADLARSYREVLRYVPSSSEPDELEADFPRYAEGGRLELSAQVAMLHAALHDRRDSLRRQGVLAGRARVAVDSQGGERSCRFCGHCLEGCAYGSIFNPRDLWQQLRRQGVVLRQGAFAREFREHADFVELTVLDAAGRPETLRTRRLFIGAGALNSTRIVARSVGWTGKPIRVLDSQYFFFPLLSYRAAPAVPNFTLAELFLEVLNEDLSPYFTHFQVYGLNGIFRQALRGMVPSVLRRPSVMSQLERRFFLFQGFLHSKHSGGLELTLRSSDNGGDHVTIRGLPNPDSLGIARAAQRLLRKELLGFGLIPPVYLNMVPLGRSFHIGGSFPMGGSDPVFRSDRIGRPAGLSRVHLLDAATFPTIPATTITLSIMAQADRVVSETFGGRS